MNVGLQSDAPARLPFGVRTCIAYNKAFWWRFRDRSTYYETELKNQRNFRESYFDQEYAKTPALLSRFEGVSIKGKRVLDFGCLFGGSTLWYAENGAACVTGLDVNESAIAFAREAVAARMSDVMSDVRFDISADSSIPLNDNSIDLIITEDVVEHLMNPEAIFAEWNRVLAPGGHVLISFGPPWLHPHGVHLWEILPGPWNHVLFSERTVSLTTAYLKRREFTPKTYAQMGMNKMTLRRFSEIVSRSHFVCTSQTIRAVWKLNMLLHVPVVREFFASQVECILTKQPANTP